MESLGDRIAKLRKELNINQKELATKVGITEASLSRYENNLREPKSEIIVRLAKSLKTSTDYLLGINENTKINREDKLIIESLSVSEKTKQLLEKIYSLEEEDREAIEKMIDNAYIKRFLKEEN
ncbi:MULTISPECIES: helix-turn-helix domain-containing protein [unclassified Clostridioides]|uniref:helix-turn-helix domain-containing protein n=1 Tax=unclassified Clostridioides TaxID=2635829 RepID=UPI001D0CAF2C|nr:helix-turn-helix transcriptional regulator [Clostridioides sp. ES-S-0001-02]MCC0638674.1 helix-turn-helix transcriptional regulator [Clostridioides sp. ES-S-0049-03]MCC0652491.1 helix-turn-helix transcriptional regulator [Clostridioides sp. ES-S-0001-03]MCC0655162.1 helix-turn-helix transcriptional regulator [Clostridioides sp. ES-S-0123-01]MCC0673039.1 helix-turn-helix transcriptional regulator [Clostridioides sp. ES-S-0145-01]MCC0675062.1 helix-turn-helix transcriptional regulator [Clostr